MGDNETVHVVVIAGGNNDLAKNLEEKLTGRVQFSRNLSDVTFLQGESEYVTVEVARDPANTNEKKPYYVFGDELALLMDMADVIITKPGGGSPAEIAYGGTPAVL